MITVAPCMHTLYCDYAQQAQCIFNDAQVQLQLDYIYCIYRLVRYPPVVMTTAPCMQQMDCDNAQQARIDHKDDLVCQQLS